MITKPTYSTSLAGYVAKVEDLDALSGLQKNTENFRSLFEQLTDDDWQFAYETGKWTIKEMIQHITDTERIFGYRMMRLLRQDATPLPGYDENTYALHGKANNYTPALLASEFFAVRSGIQHLFAMAHPEDLDFEGNANGNPVTARAIAFAIVGHAMHHLQIIHQRYLPHLAK
jgi:hypothetical protein